MKLTKWSKNKKSYAEKSNRIWIAITEKNVKGMCNYTKELNAKHIDVECGRNTDNTEIYYEMKLLLAGKSS